VQRLSLGLGVGALRLGLVRGSPWLCRTAGNPGTDPLRMTASSANDALSVTATSQVISTDPSFVNSYTQASIHAIYTYSILVDCN
jgi:hypothetical protein